MNSSDIKIRDIFASKIPIGLSGTRELHNRQGLSDLIPEARSWYTQKIGQVLRKLEPNGVFSLFFSNKEPYWVFNFSLFIKRKFSLLFQCCFFRSILSNFFPRYYKILYFYKHLCLYNGHSLSSS